MAAARPRVLILNSEPLNLNLYSLILEGGGFEPVPVALTVRGADVLPEAPPDCVLLEHDLDVTPTVAWMAVQLRERYPATPILLLSVFPQAPREMAASITATVQKGDPKRVLDALRRHVGSNGEDHD